MDALIKNMEVKRMQGLHILMATKDNGVIFGCSLEHLSKIYRNLRSKIPVICPECDEPRLISAKTLIQSKRGSICQTCGIKLGYFERKRHTANKYQHFSDNHDRLKELVSHHSPVTKLLSRPWRMAV